MVIFGPVSNLLVFPYSQEASMFWGNQIKKALSLMNLAPMPMYFLLLSSHKILLANGQITQKQTKRIGRTFFQYSFSIFSTSSRPVNT